METTCIMCPMGCNLKVEEKGGNVVVSGNTCPRGAKYGEQEFTCPKRTVTTLLKTDLGGVVSVKTSEPVDKNKVQEVIAAAAHAVVSAKCRVGERALADVAGSGADFIVTANFGYNK